MGDKADDGWTNVLRGKGSRAPKADNPYPRSRDPSITTKYLHKSYDQAMQIWRHSICRASLREIIDKKRPDEGWDIENAICFACGSFTNHVNTNQRRSLYQFAAFMDTASYVRSSPDQTIDIHAEELEFSPVDIEFLENLNVTVHSHSIETYADNPIVLAPIGPKSLIFELYIELDALPTILGIMDSKAPLIVSTDMLDRLAPLSSRDSPYCRMQFPNGLPKALDAVGTPEMKTLGERWAREVEGRHFPNFDRHQDIFNGLMVYSRRAMDSDEEEAS